VKEPGGTNREEVFAPEERAILRFADLLISYPGNIQPVDLDGLDEHFNEEQLVELVVTIATANWTNQINDGFQTPLT
jgi:alkylhydroperoxidase family enzyme